MANHLPKDDRGLVRIGGPISGTTASLRIVGDDLDPDEITVLLGCAPTGSHRKGDLKVIGKTGNKYIRKFGVWRLKSGAAEQESVDAQIKALLVLVTGDLAVWRAINSRFSAHVFCGLFMNRSNEGLVISAATLGLLAERGIELHLDIYSPEFNEDLDAHFEAAKLKKNKPLI